MARTSEIVKPPLTKKTYTEPNPMNFALILLFLIATLAIPVFFYQYRKANAAQRRQILLAAVGAFVLAGGMLCFLAFR